MTDRFARAVFHNDDDYCIITIRTGNGDYHELTALDRYHAETKLHEFARVNKLILTECAGFDGRSARESAPSRPSAREVASPAASRYPSRKSHLKRRIA